jgi:hypothetical protein
LCEVLRMNNELPFDQLIPLATSVMKQVDTANLKIQERTFGPGDRKQSVG